MRDINPRLPLMWFVWLCALLGQAAPAATGPVTERRSLIGAWTLVSITYEGPKGPLLDPYYQPDSTGIIIYEPSGWMSVSIGAPRRPEWEPAASRLPSSAPDPDLERKAAAFDTYYAYYGTWDFDKKTSVVTHHLKSSLIPSERGHDYTQRVTLDDGRLVFINHSTDHGEDRVRKKVWERVQPLAR